MQQALAKDPLQYTALMLQANDNFTHARYAQAIAIWQQLLESDNPDIDRAVIIRDAAVILDKPCCGPNNRQKKPLPISFGKGCQFGQHQGNIITVYLSYDLFRLLT
ncbi:TPA: hypothetical protein U5D84_000154 [Yersinia enterocolitica]|nr:hypothetical protein [Yersinia enterocolitica]